MSDPASSGDGGPSLIERLRGLLGFGGASVRDDIQDALEDTTAQSDFSAQERTMMKNVLALHEVGVQDVMVPRADIFAVALSMTIAEVMAMFRTAGHSRLPVYGATLDDPRGMIHVRDLLDHIAAAEEPVPCDATAGDAAARARAASGTPRREPAPEKLVRKLGSLDLTQPLSAARILRPVLFVPPSMPALDLLVKMQTTRTHMALVIDEYGGTDGLASIEDIVEMIVGDIGLPAGAAAAGRRRHRGLKRPCHQGSTPSTRGASSIGSPCPFAGRLRGTRRRRNGRSGRRVTRMRGDGAGSIRSTVKAAARTPRIATASSRAKPLPMQTRGPAPKGR